MRRSMKWLAGLAVVALLVMSGTGTAVAADEPSSLYGYWTAGNSESPHSDASGNMLMNDCSGTHYFRAYWLPPEESRSNYQSTYKIADRWEAEITPQVGASNAGYSMRNTRGNREHPEMRGSVRLNGFSVVSVRVRGYFGSDGWGDWSSSRSLFCFPG